MKIEFIGGARTVTGSSYIIKDEDFSIMVDCGMFQGKRELLERNELNLIYAPKKIDCMILTHAHIDHSGLIPKLVKEGFFGNIYATKATTDLCSVMLADSGHIQEMDVFWENKKNRKLGRPEKKPIYTSEDAQKCIENFVPVNYGEKIQVHPRVSIRFRDAGHILGSSFVEMWVEEKGKQTKIVFSGDIGPGNQAIIRDPEVLEDADYILIESTYGNRMHKPKEDTYSEFAEILNNSINKNGNIIIPAFAVERTQEIIYTLNKLFNEKKIPPIPVYIDSPLAISATEIFRANRDCFDDETQEMIISGDSPLDFPHLIFTRTKEESKALTKGAKGAIIISASGMCTAGRVKFHLQNNLYRPESSIIFVGYQAEGTLGRRIVDGAKQVKIYGETIAVNASVYTLGGFSGHADQAGLLKWLSTNNNPAAKVFIVHGEEETALTFSKIISQKFNLSTHVPRWGEILDLETMRSEFSSYTEADSSEYESTDKQLGALKETLELLASKYKNAKKGKSNKSMEQIEADIKDVKEMINMIIDEL